MKIFKYLFWGAVFFCLLYFATDFKIGEKTFKQHVDLWVQSQPKLLDWGASLKKTFKTNQATKQIIGDEDYDVKKWKAEKEEISKKDNEKLIEVLKKNK